MKALSFLIAIAFTPAAFAAPYSLQNSDASAFFSILRQSGAVVRTQPQSESTSAVNLICWKGVKSDGTPFRLCSFSSGGSRQVPPAQVEAMMSLMRRAGIPATVTGTNTILKAATVGCTTFQPSGVAPRSECAFTTR